MHTQLAALVGRWEGSTRVWFEPGKLADESPARGAIRAILGGRFVIHEYEGAIGDERLEGVAIYGYNLNSGNYECAWVDSFHMGNAIMFSVGEGTAPRFSVLGHYPDPSGGPDWGWRTEIELVDPDHLVITAYNIPPGRDEAKGVETRYRRVG